MLNKFVCFEGLPRGSADIDGSEHWLFENNRQQILKKQKKLLAITDRAYLDGMTKRKGWMLVVFLLAIM